MRRRSATISSEAQQNTFLIDESRLPIVESGIDGNQRLVAIIAIFDINKAV
jgi:hypothetical protein